MHVSKINEINNYRNLQGIQVDFSKDLNFIVGKTNVGKTNLLELLNKILNIGKFNEMDFCDVTEPIVIEFIIKYSKDEIGYFEDNFDIDDELQITLLAVQDTIDSRIEYFHKSSEIPISSRKIKGLNFIYYSSLRFPSKELNFINNIGTGKVLNYLMKESISNQEVEEDKIIETDLIENVIDDLNDYIDKLNGLSKEKIKAFINQDRENVINRIIEIGDEGGRSLSNLGDGLQYGFNIFLNILELIIRLKTTLKDENYEKLMIYMPDGKKYLPLMIGLDEPEVHQHPYRQRALIKSIKNIIDNENKKFVQLLKSLFDIDGFIGQVFVVTHSPSILLNDYKQLIRIHKCQHKIKATCGMNIEFDPKVHKHLLRSFMYIKEAMFSKSVILVEGDTEFGAVPIFANRLDYDLDEEEIGVIKLDGADSVKRCLELYKEFEIDANAIIDHDKKYLYKSIDNVYFTCKKDFEYEVLEYFSLKQYIKYLDEINKFDCMYRKLESELENFDSDKFRGLKSEYPISEEDALNIFETMKDEEYGNLQDNKTAINGSLLALYVDNVPPSFSKVINIAVSGVEDE